MNDAFRAGIAVYNAGEFHAAHDAWEDHWLDLESGTTDERLLHGLIQFTAAVHHATGRNWSGATGLAASARDYLADLPSDYRGVNVDAVRTELANLHADPELVERRRPLSLRHEGTVVRFADLTLAEAGVAAGVLAEEYGYDEDVVDDAVRYAAEETERGRSRFAALLYDFLEAERRALVYDRLSSLVERRRSKESDVRGLFD